MFTPHELQPRSRQLGRIPFPSLTPWADSNNASVSPELRTPFPIQLATPVLPRQGYASRQLQPQGLGLGEIAPGNQQAQGTVSTSVQKSRLGTAPTDTPASPLLWPSCTPSQSSQHDSTRKSPSLASLPKPSLSLQDSRDRDRGKSGLLSSLHARSSARRTLQQPQAPMSPSLPKAARADPALVNFAISARREKQESPLLTRASASASDALTDDLAAPLKKTALEGASRPAKTGGSLDTSPASSAVQPGAWRRNAPTPSSPLSLTSAQPSRLMSAQHMRPSASLEGSRASGGTVWAPMQTAHRTPQQPLGSGKLRVAGAAAPSDAPKAAAQADRASASLMPESAPAEASASVRQPASVARHAAKARGKERLEELQAMLRDLGGLVLPQPPPPPPVQALELRPPSGAAYDEAWAQERLERLRGLQTEAADALAARQEDHASQSGRVALAEGRAAAQTAAPRAALLSTVTQPALRQRHSGGGADGCGGGGRRAVQRARPVRSSETAGESEQAQGVAERLRRLQALQSEAAQFLVA